MLGCHFQLPDGLARHALRSGAAFILVALLAQSAISAVAWAPGWTQSVDAEPGAAPAHLVVSEVMTGGDSASDEFIEIYNPTPQSLPLAGVEVVYVSASGLTVSRKAEWSAEAAPMPPGSHLLIANDAGAHASAADATYAGGLAATGGSVAIRVADSPSAIDAVGWGSAASTWLEGTAAVAPGAGHSIERLPGGELGSGQDTDDNATDFVERSSPDPQGSSSTPIPPGSTPAPTPTPFPSGAPTPIPTATPGPEILSIEAARALLDGSMATIEAVALTDSQFTDGGGYVADASGGIAVIVSDGSFSRGAHLRVTGELDDRYHQRTIRATGAGITVIGIGQEPPATATATGEIGESTEGELITAIAALTSTGSSLTSGIAFDLDDGSGSVRLVVHTSSGIDTSAWSSGTQLRIAGVVGQRDSSGSGTSGYRLQPRDPADVIAATPPGTPTPSASTSQMPSPAPTSAPPLGSVLPIAEARALPTNARVRVEGVVTLPSSVLGNGTAALQDPSGAIVLRLGDEAGHVALGERIEVEGRRGTKSGMETIQVSTPPIRLGSAAQPPTIDRSTGQLSEEDEARLLTVRGEVTGAPRRTSAENTYFDLDDGSGPARLFVSPRTGIDLAGVVAGSWVEVSGVLGQETSGQQALRGYRLWPRQASDLRIVSAAGASPRDAGGAPGGPGTSPGGAIDDGIGTARGDVAPGDRQGYEAPSVDLIPPRLVLAAGGTAARSPRPSVRRSSDTAPATPDRADLAMALLGIAAVAGAGASASAARGGIGRRLAETLDAVRGEPRATDVPRSAADAGVDDLLPLSISDSSAATDAHPSPRSTIGADRGRILPPT